MPKKRIEILWEDANKGASRVGGNSRRGPWYTGVTRDTCCHNIAAARTHFRSSASSSATERQSEKALFCSVFLNIRIIIPSTLVFPPEFLASEQVQAAEPDPFLVEVVRALCDPECDCARCRGADA